ncbi:MAG: ATP-dependent DNA helicase [Oceanococcaceae bacterium]
MDAPSDTDLIRFRIGVRPFCRFVARSGDLFRSSSPGPTAAQGLAGHRAAQSRRPSGYSEEVTIRGVVDAVLLRGRIDGVYTESPMLEEVKTHRGPVERIDPAQSQLHWAQLMTYGALYVQEHGLERLGLRLCYWNIDTREEHHDDRDYSSAELLDWLRARVAVYRRWAEAEAARRTRRDAWLAGRRMPYAHTPDGQRQLMRAAWAALGDGTPLLAEAPTGNGKTLAMLLPTLHALGQGTVDRIFYLTARRSTRREVWDDLRQLARPTDDSTIPLRTLELIARDNHCDYPDRPCHGDACPLARGFHDRLPAARDAAAAIPHLDAPALATIAADHQLCRYWLGQEMAPWADLIIGDAHHYLDSSGLLYDLTVENTWAPALLLDEAHNLPDRAREMYSATIDQATLRAIAPRVSTSVRADLQGVDAALSALVIAQQSLQAKHPEKPPADALRAINEAIATLLSDLAEHPTRHDREVLDVLFALMAFSRLAESYGDHALCCLNHHGASAEDLLRAPLVSLGIQNVLPAPYLEGRFAAARAVLAFSATLTPAHFYQAMLGLPERTRFARAPSAFPTANFRVRCATDIPTGRHQRLRTAPAIANLIATQYHQAPGNYLVFVSSFTYLHTLAAALRRHPRPPPQVPPNPTKTDPQRARVIDSFQPDRATVGLAVLGGIFGEGINLPGRRLVGTFVVTLGLPEYNTLNRRMAERLHAHFGEPQGEDFTFLYPGLRKVVQAAGRVIRSSSDTGVLWLIDPRYARPRVRRLLPADWWDNGAATDHAGTDR